MLLGETLAGTAIFGSFTWGNAVGMAAMLIGQAAINALMPLPTPKQGALELVDLEPMRLAFRTAVNAKRLAVITAGTTVAITGHGSVALQGRPEDQTSLQGLAFGAQLRLGMGDSTTLMDFLDRENVLHQLVPMQMLELWQKGAAFVSAIYARSWAIKEMDPSTTDIEDPELWVPDT